MCRDEMLFCGELIQGKEVPTGSSEMQSSLKLNIPQPYITGSKGKCIEKKTAPSKHGGSPSDDRACLKRYSEVWQPQGCCTQPSCRPCRVPEDVVRAVKFRSELAPPLLLWELDPVSKAASSPQPSAAKAAKLQHWKFSSGEKVCSWFYNSCVVELLWQAPSRKWLRVYTNVLVRGPHGSWVQVLKFCMPSVGQTYACNHCR